MGARGPDVSGGRMVQPLALMDPPDQTELPTPQVLPGLSNELRIKLRIARGISPPPFKLGLTFVGQKKSISCRFPNSVEYRFLKYVHTIF